jgi:O-acetyl-ADP-ribose deacetylase (regulator of RNase III)
MTTTSNKLFYPSENGKISYIKGNIVDVGGPAIIVHGVNCQGAMNSGVARAIREKWPEVYQSYENYFITTPRQTLLGSVNVVQIEPTLIVINGFTQEFYGKDEKQYVSYEALRLVFEKAARLQGWKKLYHQIYFPKIGAGLGGGDWNIISKIIEESLSNCGGTCVEL